MSLSVFALNERGKNLFVSSLCSLNSVCISSNMLSLLYNVLEELKVLHNRPEQTREIVLQLRKVEVLLFLYKQSQQEHSLCLSVDCGLWPLVFMGNVVLIWRKVVLHLSLFMLLSSPPALPLVSYLSLGGCKES